MNDDILFSSSPEQVALDQQRFITKVYGWMAGALAITGLVAWYTVNTASMLEFIFGNRAVFIGLMIGQILLVASLAGWINKISTKVATLIFFAYAVLTDLVF